VIHKNIKKIVCAPLVFVGLLFFMLSWRGGEVRGGSDTTAPRVPQFFSVELQGDVAVLRWQENSEWDMFSYEVGVRSAAEKQVEDVKLTGLRHSYSLSGLEPGEQYFVSLAARDISGNTSSFTEEIGFEVPEEASSGFELHGWVPATSDQLDAVVSFESNRELFSSISPFEYALEEDGSISKRGDVFSEETEQRTQQAGIDRLPSVTNNFDTDGKSTALLLDGDRRARAIQEIVALVEENGYDGIDIDFENVSPEARDQFTAFIVALSDKLHENGKKISVTVQPKKSDEDTWSGVGAQDFEALGKVADQVRIMSYDFSRLNTDPGPIAPIRWYEEVLTYAVSKIPAEKIIAGVPTYAYRWCVEKNADPCESDALVWEGVRNVVAAYDPDIEWSGEYEAPWFSYEDTFENEYIVYFENNQSIEKKLDVVKDLGLKGVSLWRLGNEDPEIYSLFAERIDAQARVPKVKIEPRDQEIEIFFTDEEKPEGGYRIYYTSKNTEERFIDVFSDDSYSIPALENGETYTIWVEERQEQVVSPRGDSKKSSAAQRFTAIPADTAYPGTVEDVSIEDIGSETIRIAFNSVGDEYDVGLADYFEIRYAPFEISERNINEAAIYSSAPSPAAPGERQEWELRGLEGGKRYYIAVRAYDEAGNVSNVSNVVEARTIDLNPPAMPAVLGAIGGDEHIEVTWRANQEEDIKGYRVYFRSDEKDFHVVDLGKEANSLNIPSLENNRVYELAVSAIDLSDNESEKTEITRVVPRSDNSLTRFSEEMLLDKEKIRGSLYLFGDKVINERALPYLAMLAVIVINIFIYYSFKGEILRLVSHKHSVSVPRKHKQNARIVSDMK
jgi:spore germination protein YaaH